MSKLKKKKTFRQIAQEIVYQVINDKTIPWLSKIAIIDTKQPYNFNTPYRNRVWREFRKKAIEEIQIQIKLPKIDINDSWEEIDRKMNLYALAIGKIWDKC